MNRRRCWNPALLAMLLAAGPALAQPPATPDEPPPSPPAPAAPAAELPPAQSILDRYVEATGGRAAYEKITSRSSTGKFEMPAMGLSGDLRLDQAAPDKFRITINLPGLGQIDSGTNGEIAWSTDMMTGPRLIEGEEREQLRRGAIFNADLHAADIYEKLETTAIESMDGRDCYRVVLTPRTGSPVTSYYDKETGLIVKSSVVQQSNMGEIAAETYFSGWQDVDGVKQAHVITQKIMGMEQRMVFSKIEQNIELPPDRFEPPEDVKALLAPKPVEEPAEAPAEQPANEPK